MMSVSLFNEPIYFLNIYVPQREHIIDTSFPHKWFFCACIKNFCLNRRHERIGKRDRHFSPHSASMYLEIVFPLNWKEFSLSITVLCKSNANVFRRNSRLFLAFRRKNIQFSMEANFQRKVTIIHGAYCSLLCEFSNDNSFGTKSDFEFSCEKALCSINDFEHKSEISLFISSAQTFPSILWTTIFQVRSCCDYSFVLSSP